MHSSVKGNASFTKYLRNFFLNKLTKKTKEKDEGRADCS
jgi:hypothetical protein